MELYLDTQAFDTDGEFIEWYNPPRLIDETDGKAILRELHSNHISLLIPLAPTAEQIDRWLVDKSDDPLHICELKDHDGEDEITIELSLIQHEPEPYNPTVCRKEIEPDGEQLDLFQ